MALRPNDGSFLSGAAEILGRIGEELAFVEEDRDTGLLAINNLVMDFEELPRQDVPEGVFAGLSAFRGLLDRILDGPGKFSRESIQFMNGWHSWMSSALIACERGSPIPPPPATWSQSPHIEPKVDAVAPAAAPSPVNAAVAAPTADEPGIHLNVKDDGELLREFHSESLELLQGIEQGLLLLEENPADAGTINTIFRAFHTFKGSAGMLHLDALRDLAHDLESLLDAARRSELKITSDVINVILTGADTLKQFTSGIGEQLQGIRSGEAIVVPTLELRKRVRATLEGKPLPKSSQPPVAREAGPAENQQSTPAPQTEPAGSVPRPAVAPKSDVGASAKVETAAGFVKLDTRKLDALVDLVGELVISQSMVVQDPTVQQSASRHLARCLRQLSRITTDLQRLAMSLRMVPIGRTFQRMTRLVRDLAAQQQKQVQLIIGGEETELDRNIVEQLTDPLVHMIRNAIDHGIERPEERLKAGKPASGTIRLSAAHERGGIVIEIRDDGKGLDRERILSKGLERGLVKPHQTLTEAEVFGLIFAPGFSTAETVTDVSGRGVGMDVVKRNVEKLRGKVEIESVAGQGTTFTVVLPLTLAIIDGMLVGVGEDRYIIPTLSVRESFRPMPGMVTTVHERGEVVSVRGRLTPVLRLGQHLGRQGRVVDPTDGIIVVVESGNAARGLLVDELLGKQEVVIKNLGETFRNQDLLAGAAILGDGRVGLILDVDTLVKCQRTNN